MGLKSASGHRGSEKRRRAVARSVIKRKSVHRTVLRPLSRKCTGRESCEDFAREAVRRGGDAISASAVERALSLAEIPLSASRKNVIPKGQQSVRGAICGLFVFAAKIGVSSFTRQFPWLTQLLVEFCRKEQPHFKFTSIQVNVDYASKPHVDRNNLGASFIIGLGNYTGGKLWVHDDSGRKKHTLDEDITLAPMYKKQDTYLGREINIRNRWTQFDGNRLHFTRPFNGVRYSLVYFTCDRYAESPSDVREELKIVGFPLNWESVKLQKMLATKRVERQRVHKLFTKERNHMHLGVVPHLLDADRVSYKKENPKKHGCMAYKRYQKYSRAKTVGEAVKLGALAIDLVFDYNHGFMQVAGLHTRPAEWDFEIADYSGRPNSLPSSTAISAGHGKMVKLRVGEMTAMNKGIDVPRNDLAMLAARVGKLHRTPEARWATESSPTAQVPLAALRVLLHWARHGRLCCARGRQKQAVCDALKLWGENRMASLVEAEGEASRQAGKRRRENP